MGNGEHYMQIYDRHLQFLSGRCELLIWLTVSQQLQQLVDFKGF